MHGTNTFLAIALAVSVAVVAWGLGGWAPWAALALELSAVALAGVLLTRIVLATSRSERRKNAAVARATGRKLLGRRPATDIEIVSPDEARAPGPYRDPIYVCGYPFRRLGAGLVATALTLWIALSLLPLPASWLRWIAPKAFELRSQAASLIGDGTLPGHAPWSLTPFLSFEALLLWLAYVTLFWVSYHVAHSSRAVRRLSSALFLIGVGSGGYGLTQWLYRLRESANDTRVADYLTTGSFGNRNHYALFQEMLLGVSLGWLLYRWSETERRARDRTSFQEAKARTTLITVGLVVIGLGLLFSFSRSGITFATIAGAFFVYQTRKPSRSVRPILVVPALVLLAGALWIGVDPIVSRFALVSEELAFEGDGRTTVWRDSLGAVSDFWATGSGLGSFAHVYPLYRSFGGRRFFSWAHNDYLQLLVELGVPGFLLAAAAIFWIVRRAHRVRRGLAIDPGARDLHAGYSAAALTVGLHSFTDFGLHLPANAALLAVLLGVVTGMTPKRRVEGKKAERRIRKKTRRRKKLRRAPPAA